MRTKEQASFDTFYQPCTELRPTDFMEAIEELYDEYIQLRRDVGDSIISLPDLEAAIHFVREYGIGTVGTLPKMYEMPTLVSKVQLTVGYQG